MLANRVKTQIPLIVFPRTSNKLHKYYSKYRFYAIFGTLCYGLAPQGVMLILDHIMALYGIYVGNCDSFQCALTESIKTTLLLLYIPSICYSLALFFYLLVLQYHALFDSKLSRKDLVKDIAILALTIILPHLLVIILCFCEENLLSKLNILGNLSVKIFKFFCLCLIIVFLTFPRKLTLNLFLANTPCVIISWIFVSLLAKYSL